MIPSPYLLCLGDSTDELSAKTSRGVAVWRPEQCLGEYRGQACTVSLGLPHLDFAEAAAAGAKTFIIGVANAGGVMGASAVQHAVAALKAGLNVASGLHDRLRDHPEIVAAAAGRRSPPQRIVKR